jgi:hypothetical protein
MSTLSLAKGVEFIEDKHEYWHKGRQLSGITGLIARKLGLKMPQEFVEEHQMEGIHVHKAVQKWIETGDPDSAHPGVKWLTSTFYNRYPIRVAAFAVFSEVLVSDFSQYASSVDIVASLGKSGLVDIFDIKKGVFKREYVTWQLSIYKYFLETYAKRTVRNCVCICIKDKEYYDIFPKPREQVEKLLYG